MAADTKTETKTGGLQFITLTQEQFELLLSRAGGAQAAPVDGNELAVQTARMQSMRAAISPKGEPPKRVACKHPRNGCTFDAMIQFSKSYPDGRIMTVENVTFPEGHDVSVKAGGLCPLDTDAIRLKSTGMYLQAYKEWAWKEYYQRVLLDYVGMPARVLEGHDKAAL